MADLGITYGEIVSELPDFLGEVWEHYSDDKKITPEEGVLLIAHIAGFLGEAADDEVYQEFFSSLAGTMTALSPLVEKGE